MDWTSLMGGTAAQEFGQYPDKRLYKSAQMLPPEDRPRVPVRLVDPDPEKYPIFRAVPSAGGWANVKDNGPIMLNQKAEFMNEPVLLASKMAHEAQHYKTGVDDEWTPYQKEISILEQSPKWRNSDYTRRMRQLGQRLKDGYK